MQTNTNFFLLVHLRYVSVRVGVGASVRHLCVQVRASVHEIKNTIHPILAIDLRQWRKPPFSWSVIPNFLINFELSRKFNSLIAGLQEKVYFQLKKCTLLINNLKTKLIPVVKKSSQQLKGKKFTIINLFSLKSVNNYFTHLSECTIWCLVITLDPNSC